MPLIWRGPTAHSRSDRLAWLFALAGMASFWALRVFYWSAVEEIPFSDMANFDRVAHGIAASFDFSSSQFWQTYTTPSLVTARAIQILLLGDSLLAWQIFQAALTFVSLCWLALELYRRTGSRGLAVALIFAVAWSKPSIFWSLKLSREGFHEALTYLCIAAFLFAVRRPSWSSMVTLGGLLAVNFLNKPNVLLAVPIVVLLAVASLSLRTSSDEAHSVRAEGRPLNALLAITLGVALIWGPWIGRSIAIYGEPVLLNTQGPYVILWELGQVTVRLPNGIEVETSANDLHSEASERFSNDLEALKYARQVSDAWLRQNLDQLPELAGKRVWRTITDRTIYLTRVPRNRLFGTRMDHLLLDKSRTAAVAGIAGLSVLPLLFGWRLLVIPTMVLIPWLSAAAILSYPRMFEAAIPLVMFGNVAWLILAARAWRQLRPRLRLPTAAARRA